MSELQDIIVVRGWSVTHPSTAYTWLKEVIDLANKGYIMHPKPTVAGLPTLHGYPTVTMVSPKWVAENTNGNQSIPQDEPKKEDVTSSENDSEDEQVHVEEVIVDKSELEVIESLSSKVDMLEFAEEKGLVIPEDKKVPKAIKAWLLEQYK